MKFLIITIAIALSAFTMPIDSINLAKKSGQDSEKVEIKIIVSNLNTTKGYIEMGIYNSSKGYLKNGYAYKTVRQEVKGNTVEIILQDMPKGNYAVSLYHDENNDKKCNTNILGVPTEPYGFSNGFRRRLFKPSFEDCKVEVQSNTVVKVVLID